MLKPLTRPSQKVCYFSFEVQEAHGLFWLLISHGRLFDLFVVLCFLFLMCEGYYLALLHSAMCLTPLRSEYHNLDFCGS